MRKYVVGKNAVYYTVILLRSALHDCNNMPGLYHTNTEVVLLIKNSVWKKKLLLAKWQACLNVPRIFWIFDGQKCNHQSTTTKSAFFQTDVLSTLFSLKEYTIIITLQWVYSDHSSALIK